MTRLRGTREVIYRMLTESNDDEDDEDYEDEEIDPYDVETMPSIPAGLDTIHMFKGTVDVSGNIDWWNTDSNGDPHHAEMRQYTDPVLRLFWIPQDDSLIIVSENSISGSMGMPFGAYTGNPITSPFDSKIAAVINSIGDMNDMVEIDIQYDGKKHSASWKGYYDNWREERSAGASAGSTIRGRLGF